MDRHQSQYIPSSNLDFNGYYVRPTYIMDLLERHFLAR